MILPGMGDGLAGQNYTGIAAPHPGKGGGRYGGRASRRGGGGSVRLAKGKSPRMDGARLERRGRTCLQVRDFPPLRTALCESVEPPTGFLHIGAVGGRSSLSALLIDLLTMEALGLFFLGPGGNFQAAWTPPATINLGAKNFVFSCMFLHNSAGYFLYFYSRLFQN